jgi:hypothetical protein
MARVNDHAIAFVIAMAPVATLSFGASRPCHRSHHGGAMADCWIGSQAILTKATWEHIAEVGCDKAIDQDMCTMEESDI